MSLALAFDALLAVLLIATIGYAVVLNRKLSALRAARDEMAGLADRFAEATAKAESGLGEMRGLAEESGEILERRIARAQGLRDELAFILESGAGLAKRLERGRGPAEAPAAEVRGIEDQPRDEPLPDKRALFEALQGMR